VALLPVVVPVDAGVRVGVHGAREAMLLTAYWQFESTGDRLLSDVSQRYDPVVGIRSPTGTPIRAQGGFAVNADTSGEHRK
jgi:hypothetical protein